MNFSDEIISLGQALSSAGAQYKTKELFQGIKNEQVRLGKNPFVIVVNISSFDIDGLTDFVFLIDSFLARDEATGYARNLSNSLLEFQLKQDNWGQPWVKSDSQDAPSDLPEPKSNCSFKVINLDTFKVTSGEFDKKYVTTRVIETDGKMVVGQPLFDFINSNFELWSYFVGVGESTGGDIARPTPFMK
jgi:hypothetical protein